MIILRDGVLVLFFMKRILHLAYTMGERLGMVKCIVRDGRTSIWVYRINTEVLDRMQSLFSSSVDNISVKSNNYA